MTEQRIVPVKTWLRPDTYRKLDAHAQRRSTTVDALLSTLADAAITTPPRPKQQYTRITAAMITATRSRLAAGETLTAIAADYGCSRLGLRKAITRKDQR